MTKNTIGPGQEETMGKKESEQYFTAIQERFDCVEERFNSLEERYDNRFTNLESRFDNLESRMNRLENVCYAILEVVRGNDVKMANFDRRLLKLEQRAV